MKRGALRIRPGTKVCLRDFDPGDQNEFHDKESARERFASDIKKTARLQDDFYATDSYSLLIIFQVVDAAGKDGATKHVMSGLKPQGCQAAAFKSPSARELDHDYLWRCNLFLPERGRIGIFNRSYYEEVLAVRVHPDFLHAQKLPEELREGKIWKRRYGKINNFEEYHRNNGTHILKFFLHISKDEQKRRLMERIENPAKNWKLSPSDVKERAHWDEYQRAYEDMLEATSTENAPGHVVPADHKWFSRVVISEVVVKTLEGLDLKYPELDEKGWEGLEEACRALEAEDS